MSLDLNDTDTAVYNNALFLAWASDLAYLEGGKGREEFQKSLGLDATFFSAGNTQAYVAHDANHVVVAFRGTEAPTSLEGVKDWLLTDANNFLILPEGRIGTDFAAAGVGARFHRGFMTALADIWEGVSTAVEAELKRQERPLWLTGHSLGGALALLAGWRFQQNFLTVHRIYTFGAPMVGNAAAIQAIDKEFQNKIYRFVHSPDPVPHLPTVSLIANAYGHCLKEMLLVPAAVGEAAGPTAHDFFQQLAAVGGEVLDGSVIEKIWGHLTERLGAHAIENYRTQIEAKCKELT
jgi:hypothetical protein